MSVETVKIKTSDGKEFDGIVTRPDASNGAGIILIQEIFGVNDHIRDVAKLYAQEGYTVLAPDLFWRTDPGLQLGYSESEIAKGIGIMQKLDLERATLDLIDAAQTLRKLPGIKKIGAVGYCMGGMLTYRLACRNAVDAAVSYYGGGVDQQLAEASKIKIPLLMHFADADEYISMPAIEKIKQAVAPAKAIVYLYKGVGHGFNCDQRGSYNRQAAMLAFARSIEFFNKQLVGRDLAVSHSH
jgi:carboxymethylenebutenolidase